MSQTIESLVCQSSAVRVTAAEAARIGEPLTQAMVDELERLRRHGVLSTTAVDVVRNAYSWYGPGAEADAYIAVHLGD